MPVTFLWPVLLTGLLLVPLLLAVYVRLLRRPRSILPYPTTALAAVAMRRRNRFATYLPPALLLLALTAAIMALSRPVVMLPLPADQSAIMLSVDVSGSMRSADVQPTRLDAAKAAAKTFVTTLPGRVRVGLVMFGGYAQLIVPPTTDHRRVIEEIDALQFIRRTAIGEGLLEAAVALPGRVKPGPDGMVPPVPAGPRPPGFVVLLSDGNSNTGIHPLEAAEIARRQEVTVYTVGVGQPYAPDNFGFGTIGGPLDETTLKEIARVTGGTYHHASSAERLRDIYRGLARVVGWERRPMEAGGPAAALAAMALVAALALSRLVIHPLGV